MTITEALAQRERFVRLPVWNSEAVLELPLLEDGGVGPWAILHDWTCGPSTPILITQLTSDPTDTYITSDPPRRRSRRDP